MPGGTPRCFRRCSGYCPSGCSSPDVAGTCHGLEIIAEALVGLGMPEPALRLHAAATAIREQLGMSHTTAAYLARLARFLTLARGQLGAQRSALVEAEGRALSLEQAVTHALSIAAT